MLAGDDARKARELAAQMSAWLASPFSEKAIMDTSSDLVEWCRSARDVLERIGKLADDEIQPLHQWRLETDEQA